MKNFKKQVREMLEKYERLQKQNAEEYDLFNAELDTIKDGNGGAVSYEEQSQYSRTKSKRDFIGGVIKGRESVLEDLQKLLDYEPITAERVQKAYNDYRWYGGISRATEYTKLKADYEAEYGIKFEPIYDPAQ